MRADLQARTRCANEAGAAALVSVHFNSASSPRNAGALSIYDGVRPFGASNLKFASLLQTNVLRGLNAAYGHLVILGPSMASYFTSPTTMPGSVIEPLFLTDPCEADVPTSTQGQVNIAAGITTAVTQFLGDP